MLALLTYFPLLSTGFTTNDDMRLALHPWSPTQGWQSAVNQGRVGNLLADLLLKLPYMIDSRIYFDLLRFGSPLVFLSILYSFIRQAYRSTALAILVAVFFLAFIQNNWNHNLLTSYPFIFNLLAIIFLLSIIAFANYQKHGGIYGLISAILYFICLSNELFVLFFVVFIGIAIFYEIQDGHQERPHSRTFSILKRLSPIIFSLSFFLVLYASWRYFFPSIYTGNTASLSDLPRMAKVVWIYSVSAFPGFEFFANLFAPLFFGFTPLEQGMGVPLSELRVEWLVKALIAAYLTWHVLRDKSIASLLDRHQGYGLLLALLCIFLPNILLGFTEKYRQWVEHGSTSYVYTYYSFIAVVVFLALGVASLIKRIEPHLPKMLLAGFVAFTTGILSLVTDFGNYYVTTDQQLSQQKWNIIDRFTQTAEFLDLPDNAVIYAPSLFKYRGILETPAYYWTEYLQKVSTKNLNVVAELDPNVIKQASRVFYLKFSQEPHSANQLLTFAHLSNPIQVSKTRKVREKSATIFSFGRNRQATLVGFWGDKSSESLGVWVDDDPVKEHAPGVFSAHLNWPAQKSDFPAVTIRSEKEMDIDGFVLSYYLEQPNISSLTIELGDGFYGWEHAPGQPDWSWSKGNANLTVFNAENGVSQVTLSLKIGVLRPQNLTITDGINKTHIALQKDLAQDIDLKVTAKPGLSTIHIMTDEPAQTLGKDDPRKLGFALSIQNISQP